MAQIEFTLTPGKPVEIKASGFTGKACMSATAPYEALLGRQVSTTPTAEMHATVAAPMSVKVKGS